MKRIVYSMICALALALALPAGAQTSVFTTFTNRPEEALTWCGAATGQMVMSGYPSSSCNLVQADVWDSIQTHKVEPSWDTDPSGLKDAMMTLCPPPGGGHWVVFSNASATSLMYSVAFWMNRNHFPVAVLLNTNPHNAIPTHLERWVAVKGIVTDLNPLTNSTVTLQYILIVDQAATFGDPPVERFLSGAQWYSEFAAVNNASSSYNGRFVAVIEPPERTGTLLSRRRQVTGTVIPAAQALRAAMRAAREAVRAASFRELASLQPRQPILVNPEREAYYIVPFGDEKQASTALLINAYTGEFLEAGRFKPRPILSEKEAVDRALQFTRRGQPKSYKATLVSDGDVPYYPSWRVNLDGDELLVGADAKVRRVEKRKQ